MGAVRYLERHLEKHLERHLGRHGLQFLEWPRF